MWGTNVLGIGDDTGFLKFDRKKLRITSKTFRKFGNDYA
jgi:hypothetical protein